MPSEDRNKLHSYVQQITSSSRGLNLYMPRPRPTPVEGRVASEEVRKMGAEELVSSICS